MKNKENAVAFKDLRGPPRKLAEDGQKLCLGSIALIGFREKRPMTVAAMAAHHTLEVLCESMTDLHKPFLSRVDTLIFTIYPPTHHITSPPVFVLNRSASVARVKIH